MKKFISILLAFTMLASVMLSLVSCGGDEAAKKETEKTEDKAEDKAPVSEGEFTYVDMINAMLKTYTSDSYTQEILIEDYFDETEVTAYYSASDDFVMYAEILGDYTDIAMALDSEEGYYYYDFESEYGVTYTDNFFTVFDFLEIEYSDFENMFLYLLGEEELDIELFNLNYFLYENKDSKRAIKKFKKGLNDWAADNIDFTYNITDESVEYSMEIDALSFMEEYINCCMELFPEEAEDIDYFYDFYDDIDMTISLNVTEIDGYMTASAVLMTITEDKYSETSSYESSFYDIDNTSIDTDACEELVVLVEEYESIDYCEICYVNEATIIEDDLYYCDECYIDMADEEIIEEMEEIKNDILADLTAAFENEGISIIINEKTGDISMDSSVIFGGDSAFLSVEGREFLKKFIAAYTSIIFSDEYSDLVSKTVVEGHIAPIEGSTYESGLPLSKERAANVMNFCLSEEAGLSSDYIEMLKGNIETVGLSQSRPVYDENGNVDLDASRRVTFRFVIDISKI